MRSFCLNVFIILLSTHALANVIDLNSRISSHDVTIIKGEMALVDFTLNGNTSHKMIDITFHKQIPYLVYISPIKIKIDSSVGQPIDYHWPLKITALHPGYMEVTATSVPHIDGFENIFMRITVALSWPLIYVSRIAGWTYFLAWSLSFYPQIYDNYRRKNVTGLNYDYLSFNILGSSLYCAFNIGLYAWPLIENEYLRRNARGLNPVLINDVLFAMHALAATLFTAYQCLIYESSGQKLSRTAKLIHSTFFVFLVIFFGLAERGRIHWLDFLYVCSYIKLLITLIKYIPQALMNYRRKSTVGWSIGCIYLDIVGGILSILQMIINAYNHDDWASIVGDATKMGLGIFSLSFDIFFLLQHYVFYREPFRHLKENESNLEELAERERLNYSTKQHEV